MLEMSAFRISVRWPIYIINSVDKTKFLYTLSRQFAVDLKNVRPIFFSRLPKCIPFQYCPFVSIHGSLFFCCISFLLFNSFKWLLQCFVPLSGHFGCHEITSFGSKLRKLRKLNISSVVDREAQYSSAFPAAESSRLACFPAYSMLVGRLERT